MTIESLLVFLVLNFAALAVGSTYTKKGTRSAWYQNQRKAPWTPPGWMFGFAWTIIMICFAVYMAYLWPEVISPWLLAGLYVLQWLLNAAWGPVFFYYHKVLAGLIIVSLLMLLTGLLLVIYWPYLQLRSLFILPYFLWLLIAVSLNGYSLLMNE